MTEPTPKGQGASRPAGQAHRPTGKRQLAGSSTVSSSTYEAKRVEKRQAAADTEKPGGGVGAFFPEVVAEIRKVIWPTGREMLTYTLVVFSFLIIMTALVWGVDHLTALGVDAVLG